MAANNNPSEADKQFILSAIQNDAWLETWAAQKKKNKSKHPDLKHKSYIYQTKLYRKVLDLLFPDTHFVDDNTLTLEIDPRVAGNGFLRVEYNPSKIPFSILAECLHDVIPGGIDCIFAKGSVTRLDIAMDIKDVKPYQIIIDYMKSRFRTSYLESGRPDSVYVGKDTGVNQLLLYDKGKELMANNVIKPLSVYQFPEYDLTRLELRHRPKSPTPKFADLFHLTNLFDPMLIAGTPQKIKGDTQFDVMRDLCVLKGLRYVLRHITKKDDTAFATKLEKFSVPNFLDLQKLWATLPDALKQVYPATNMLLPSKNGAT